MNFNPPMCRAGKICIAEVEEIVDIDEIPPGQVISLGVKLKDYTRLKIFIIESKYHHSLHLQL